VSRLELPPLAARVLAAYGGAERWASARSIRATLSIGGLALLVKGRWPLRHVSVGAELDFPRMRIDGLAGNRSVAWLEGGSARLASLSGETWTARGDARARLRGLRRLLWWDRLDATYFLGYLLWNELTFPRLFLRPDVEWTQLDDVSLSATFPSGFPTHCTEQIFRFDRETGLLRRHDFTADVFGRWARAAAIVIKHREWDGIMYVCRRLATPGGAGGKRFTWPVLWSEEVHGWQLSSASLS